MKIQNWLVSIGDVIKKDDPLVEVETDKVTMEIEAPDDGVLIEILGNLGDDIQPGTIIGKLSKQSGKQSASVESSGQETKIESASRTLGDGANKPSQIKNVSNHSSRFSPSVRRYVAQNNLDVSKLQGTGKGGRITLNDVKLFKNTAPLVKPKGAISSEKRTKPQAALASRVIPHSSMRRAIAKHMSHSVSVAPHVTAVFELDFTAIANHRAKHKADFAAQGVKLTYTAYFIMACVAAMKAVPEVNSQWFDDELHVFGDVNIGVGTSLGNQGLVVPVIDQSQTKNLFGIAKDLQDIITRARDNKLKPADMKGGTFTISNHGVSGSLVATPIIINQPQSAILGIGKLEKRVVVRTIEGQDVTAIKPMAFVSLTIDHRVLDGHQTNTWLTQFVHTLEHWETNHA